jgi:hypothetical protein
MIVLCALLRYAYKIQPVTKAIVFIQTIQSVVNLSRVTLYDKTTLNLILNASLGLHACKIYKLGTSSYNTNHLGQIAKI